MFSKNLFGKFFLLLLLSLYSQPVFAAKNLALLIGIDDYSLSTGFSSLTGPNNDIEITKKVLDEKRFGFNRITVLLNEKATHSRIAQAFKELADQVKKERVGSVYIFYAGHGSQTKDLNGDEPKIADLHGELVPSYDQTWVTYGARLKKGATPPAGFKEIDRFDILDDEIAEWLDDIAVGCDQVVFVSDSCHSGSVSRSAVVRGVRRGPPDPNEHPLGGKKFKPLTAKNIIRIGAGKDNQLTGEFVPEGASEEYGVFSWYWVKALDQCQPSDSWDHVFNRVSRIVFQATPNGQSPQISGAVTMKVFGANFLAPAQTIPIYQVVEHAGERRAYLAAGLLSGVTVGSEYLLESGVGQPSTPLLEITQVFPTYSIAVTNARVKVFDQVVEVAHHYELPPIRLLVKTAEEKGRDLFQAKIRSVVNRLAPYVVTDDEQRCDLILYLFRPEQVLPSTGFSPSPRISPVSNENAAPEIWVLDKDGFLLQDNLRHAYTGEGLAALTENLRKLARVKDFLRLSNAEKTFPLEIGIAPAIPMSQADDMAGDFIKNPSVTDICPADKYKNLKSMSLAEFLRRRWDLCTIIDVRAKNPTFWPYYFYVIYIRDDGEIIPVFPSLEDCGQIAEVKPGSVNTLGSELIRLDTKTLDQYKIIISRKPINHHLFAQAGYKSALRSANSLNPLERILLSALTGTRSAVTYEPDSWYAETIFIDMR